MIAALYLFYVYRDWKLITLVIIDVARWDFSTLAFFLEKSLIPVGLLGLWNLRPFGWWVTYIGVSSFIASLFMAILEAAKWRPASMPIVFYFEFIILVAIMFFINRKSIVELFKIPGKARMIVTVIIVFVVLFRAAKILI